MATNWVVSTHAAVYKSSKDLGLYKISALSLIAVPEGITLHFFVPDQACLPVDTAWVAYKHLMKNPPEFSKLNNIAGYHIYDGPKVPNYAIVGDNGWIDEQNHSASGIFIAGDTNHNDVRTIYLTHNDSLTIEKFFNGRMWQIGDQVFWLACRAWQ